MPTHQQIDAASIELGKEVASRIQMEPALLGVAAGNLDRWLAEDPPEVRRIVFQEWKTILASNNLEQIVAILEGTSETCQRLRQNSPFAGILNPSEVRRIKRSAWYAAV